MFVLTEPLRTPSGKMFWNTNIAFRYKMSSMQAAFNSELKLDKIKIMKRLAAKGISARPFFYLLSSLPAYQDFETAKKEKTII
jgi:dTDP-4-amino-4,6-dideoxygalactose transaminase